jgi:hypothetical protein
LIGNGDKHLIPSWNASEADAVVDKRNQGFVPPGVPSKARPQPQAGKGATRANALTGSLTALPSLETKVRPSILSTIKVRAKPAVVDKRAGNRNPRAGK